MANRAGARPPTPLLFGRHMRAALNSDPRRARRIRRYIGQLRPAKCVADAPCCSPGPPSLPPVTPPAVRHSRK